MNLTEIKKLCAELPTEPNLLTALEASYSELVAWVESCIPLAREMMQVADEIDVCEKDCDCCFCKMEQLLSELEP